jgi:hypothetical protein
VGHFVGLIWFDKTGTEIVEVMGARSFSNADVLRLLPKITTTHNFGIML